MTRGFELISKEQVMNDFELGEDTEEHCLSDILKLPQRATAKSAGYDFFSPFKFTLAPNQSIKIPTGIKAYMGDDEVLKVFPRSSLGFKYHLRISNTTGIIDSDYYNNDDNEGHIFIKIRNEGNKPIDIDKGEAFAQGIFEKYLIADGDSFEGNERKGGIGSTN